MNITMKVKSFVFESSDEKEAYLKGCKNLAKYIASKKYKNLSFSVERVGNSCVFNVYTTLNMNPDQKNFCDLCKEMHSSFFINEEYNCKRCNLKAFLEREDKKLRISKSFYRKEIK